MIISQAPQMEVSRKREVESIDGVPHVMTNPFLAENQDVERVAKMQKVESKEGKPHLTTNLSLAEKQEVETAKKPHSNNKNEEVAKSVESPEASKNSSDPDDDAKMQKVENREGKPCVTTYLSLDKKKEVETAKDLHSKNKNEVATPVENPEASKNSSDSDDWVEDDEYIYEPWPPCELNDDEALNLHVHRCEEDWYVDSDTDNPTYKRWKEEYKAWEEENEDRHSDSDGET